MKLKCKDCEILVIEGERINSDITGKLIFNPVKDKKYQKPYGTIFTNKSSDPKKWTAQCPSCQSYEALGRKRKKFKDDKK